MIYIFHSILKGKGCLETLENSRKLMTTEQDNGKSVEKLGGYKTY